MGPVVISAYNLRVRCVVALLVLGSCGDNLRMIENGDRLDAIVDVGGEDAEAIAYFHDRDRDIDCEFSRDAVGDWRCLPRSVVADAGYADAECTQPRVECRDCNGALEAVTFEPGCGGPVAMPLILHPEPMPAFVRVAGVCLHADFPPGAYYSTTNANADGYVAADFEDHLVTNDFGTRTLVATDGTRAMFHHAYERVGARDCSFFGGVSGPCLPGTTGSTELGLAFFFADETCSSRAAFNVKPIEPQRCEAPTHVRYEGSIHHLSAIGDRAYERSPIDSSCIPTEETDLAFFSIGDIDDSLPEAGVIALGTGAARPVYYASEGKPIAFAHRWVDADNMTCTPLPTVEGRRCIGRSLAVFDQDLRYADVACSVPLVANPEGDLYALRWEGAEIPRDVTAASRIASVHALRAFPATEMYEMRDGFCTLSADPVVLMAFVGLPLDLQKFPSVERRRAY